MKANAPEKIYLHPDLDSIFGMTERSCESEIEYCRTDAFIDRACEWFRRLDYDDTTYETTEEFVEGFKKAMKGE